TLLTEARRIADESRVPIRARNELRGRLDAYRAKAQQIGRLEDTDATRAYDRAHRVLYTAPTDLVTASELVERYQDIVSPPARPPEVPRGGATAPAVQERSSTAIATNAAWRHRQTLLHGREPRPARAPGQGREHRARASRAHRRRRRHRQVRAGPARPGRLVGAIWAPGSSRYHRSRRATRPQRSSSTRRFARADDSVPAGERPADAPEEGGPAAPKGSVRSAGIRSPSHRSSRPGTWLVSNTRSSGASRTGGWAGSTSPATTRSSRGGWS